MNKQISSSGRKRSPFGTWRCKFCGQIFETKHKLSDHYHEMHAGEFHRQSWNKGLTKETDERVRRGSEKRNIKIKTGEIIPSFKGKHHSEHTKELLRKSQLKCTNPRKCKKTKPYVCVDGSIVNLDSSYERIIAQILDSHGIKWIRPKPLDWYSSDGVKHHYFPDFFIPSWNIYLDPKNEYCFIAQAEKIAYVKSHYKNVVFLHKWELTEDTILKLRV